MELFTTHGQRINGLMPYINQKDRKFIDPAVDYLVENMLELDGQDIVPAGFANYIITSIIARSMRPASGWTYSSLSRALAVFHDAEAEMRRRLLDPYENTAIRNNGDIPEYENQRNHGE
jgi:hypothetical protein